MVQLLIVSSIVATGAGLQVAAYFIEGHAYGRPLPAVLSAVLPVAGFLGSIYVLSWYLVRRFDRFHLWLLLATAIVMAVTVIASVSGVNIAICLLMIAIAPWMTVVACELRGYVYESEAVPTSMP